MKLVPAFAASVLALAASMAVAETHEVQMLNKGEAGAMVFEPRLVEAQPGDTVKFIATDKGHNAETVRGMVPEGQDAFRGKINEEIEVELTAEGMIGVKCAPHLGMGMVMVINVGDAGMQDGFLDAKMPKRAKSAFEEIVASGATN